MMVVEMQAESSGSWCGKRPVVQKHQFSGRPHREGPETWLLVPTSHLLCDLEQVTSLLWAYFATSKVAKAKSLTLGGFMKDSFFSC